MTEKWLLFGYDTFSNEDYPIDDCFDSEEEALEAARQCLKELDESQPSEQSGGQSHHGIQDRIFIIRPDGSKYRFPANELSPQELKGII